MTKTLVVSVCLLGAVAGADEPERRIPLYTNADLDRARAGREAAGSAPAWREGDRPARESSEERLRLREEAYWRAEAERVRGRLRPFRAQLEELEAGLARLQAPRPPGLRPARRPRRDDSAAIETAERRIQSLRRRIADEETRFLDRARQAGALPGWVRSATE